MITDEPDLIMSQYSMDSNVWTGKSPNTKTPFFQSNIPEYSCSFNQESQAVMQFIRSPQNNIDPKSINTTTPSDKKFITLHSSPTNYIDNFYSQNEALESVTQCNANWQGQISNHSASYLSSPSFITSPSFNSPSFTTPPSFTTLPSFQTPSTVRNIDILKIDLQQLNERQDDLKKQQEYHSNQKKFCINRDRIMFSRNRRGFISSDAVNEKDIISDSELSCGEIELSCGEIEIPHREIEISNGEIEISCGQLDDYDLIDIDKEKQTTLIENNTSENENKPVNNQSPINNSLHLSRVSTPQSLSSQISQRDLNSQQIVAKSPVKSLRKRPIKRRRKQKNEVEIEKHEFEQKQEQNSPKRKRRKLTSEKEKGNNNEMNEISKKSAIIQTNSIKKTHFEKKDESNQPLDIIAPQVKQSQSIQLPMTKLQSITMQQAFLESHQYTITNKNPNSITPFSNYQNFPSYWLPANAQQIYSYIYPKTNSDLTNKIENCNLMSLNTQFLPFPKIDNNMNYTSQQSIPVSSLSSFNTQSEQQQQQKQQRESSPSKQSTSHTNYYIQYFCGNRECTQIMGNTPQDIKYDLEEAIKLHRSKNNVKSSPQHIFPCDPYTVSKSFEKQWPECNQETQNQIMNKVSNMPISNQYLKQISERQLYCSKKCQTREQNLRQGRVQPKMQLKRTKDKLMVNINQIMNKQKQMLLEKGSVVQ